MTSSAPLTTVPLPVKLRVEDYLMLDEAGAFAGYGKTELIDGEIVYMNAHHRPHARIKSRLFSAIATALREAGIALEALVEGSVEMLPHSAPEPDISLTTEPEGDGLIPLASLAMVVEIADTTLRTDLSEKALLYARAQIPEYWVVDIERSIIHQMWQPTDGRYLQRREIAFGRGIQSATIKGLAIETGAL